MSVAYPQGVAATGESGPAHSGSLGGGRGGPVRPAVAAVLAKARESGSWSPWDELRAVLVEVQADRVDEAIAAADPGGVQAEIGRLVSLIEFAREHLSEPAPAGGDPVGDNGRGAVLRALDSPPAVGD